MAFDRSGGDAEDPDDSSDRPERSSSGDHGREIRREGPPEVPPDVDEARLLAALEKRNRAHQAEAEESGSEQKPIDDDDRPSRSAETAEQGKLEAHDLAEQRIADDPSMPRLDEPIDDQDHLPSEAEGARDRTAEIKINNGVDTSRESTTSSAPSDHQPATNPYAKSTGRDIAASTEPSAQTDVVADSADGDLSARKDRYRLSDPAQSADLTDTDESGRESPVPDTNADHTSSPAGAADTARAAESSHDTGLEPLPRDHPPDASRAEAKVTETRDHSDEPAADRWHRELSGQTTEETRHIGGDQTPTQPDRTEQTAESDESIASDAAQPQASENRQSSRRDEQAVTAERPVNPPMKSSEDVSAGDFVDTARPLTPRSERSEESSDTTTHRRQEPGSEASGGDDPPLNTIQELPKPPDEFPEDDAEKSRAERLLRLATREAGTVLDSAEGVGNTAQDFFTPPPTGRSEVRVGPGASITEMPHGTTDAGALAAAGMAVVIVGAEAFRRITDKVSRKGRNEED